MKTTITHLVFLSLFFVQNVIGQNWAQQTSNTKNNLWDVYFVNSDTGYICGNDGTILKTINGGSAWNLIPSGVKDNLVVIQFVNLTIGYTAGSKGTLLKTINGGNTWSNISFVKDTIDSVGGGIWFTSVDTGFFAIGLLSKQNGFPNYINSKILKTHDGGVSWDTVYMDTIKKSNGPWISYFYFSDANHGWATASKGIVLKTIDGGNNWTVQKEVFVTDNTPAWMSGVYFFNKDTGYVSGGACISYPDTASGSTWKTTDGGTSWQQESTINSSGAKIFFINQEIGYSLWADCTGKGILMKTINGGDNWTNETVPTKGNIRGQYFTSINNGYAVGDSGLILKYSNMTGIKNLKTDKANITVYPNPSNQNVTIKFYNPADEKCTLTLYDIHGRLMLTINNIATSKVDIETENLTKGLYFFKLQGNCQIVATGKLIIE